MKLEIGTTKNSAQPKISLLISGEPKIGKTSLITTLPVEDDTKVLYFGADPGELALNHRNYTMIRGENNVINEDTLNELINYLARQSHKYDWIVVDGLDDVGKAILWSRMEKLKDDRAAYKDMGRIVEIFVKKIRDISGISSVFITHEKVDVDDIGKRIHSPNMPGQKFAAELLGLFDIVLAYRWFVQDGKNVRGLQASMEVDPSYICGDRSGALPPIAAPDMTQILKFIQGRGFKTTSDEALVSPSEVLQLRSMAKAAKPAEQAELKKITDAYLAEVRLSKIEELTVKQWKQLKAKIFDN